MKRLSLLTFLVILILKALAQDVSIMEPNLKWNVGTHFIFEGPIDPYDYWSTTFLHIEDDTLMNEKQYKKLISCSDSLCGKERLKSYIREEANQVFLANKKEELLQFDFNLSKGDTVIMDFLQDVSRQKRLYIRVDSVKSMIFLDQKERLAQYVTVFDYYNNEPSSYSINDIFVEGIGSLKFGLEYPITLFITGEHVISPTLLCFYSGDNLIYSNPKINNCYLSTSILEIRQPELIQVSASNGMLELRLNHANFGKFYVFDLHGKRILEQTVNKSISQFCMPEFGIFLFRFETTEGKVQTGKVLVK
jgi:hypothetical protein